MAMHLAAFAGSRPILRSLAVGRSAFITPGGGAAVLGFHCSRNSPLPHSTPLRFLEDAPPPPPPPIPRFSGCRSHAGALLRDARDLGGRGLPRQGVLRLQLRRPHGGIRRAAGRRRPVLLLPGGAARDPGSLGLLQRARPLPAPPGAARPQDGLRRLQPDHQGLRGRARLRRPWPPDLRLPGLRPGRVR